MKKIANTDRESLHIFRTTTWGIPRDQANDLKNWGLNIDVELYFYSNSIIFSGQNSVSASVTTCF